MTRILERLRRILKKIRKALRRRPSQPVPQEGPIVEEIAALRHEQPNIQDLQTQDAKADWPAQTHDVEPNEREQDAGFLDPFQNAATAEDTQYKAALDPDPVVAELGSLPTSDTTAPESTIVDLNIDSGLPPSGSLLPRINTIIAPELHVVDASTEGDSFQKRPSFLRIETSIVSGENPANLNTYSGPSPNRLSPSISATSSRRSSVSSEGNTGLYAELRSARIQSPDNTNNHFVPIGKLKHLTSATKIAEEIRYQLLLRDPDSKLEAMEIQNVAEKASAFAPKLFAILTYLKRGLDIFELLREGVCDIDLPLQIRKENGVFMVEKHSEVPIKMFESWPEQTAEDFDRYQWWMTAPIFNKLQHKDFCGCEILPFLELPADERNDGSRGAFSEVIFRQIHPDHHDFWRRSTSIVQEPFVAIKNLINSDEPTFKNEALMLNKLSSLKDPHLITLLATFKYGNRYGLVFPKADANLRKFWEQRPSPHFDGPTVLWIVEQMTGIAHALSLIHNFSEEDLYGRHGDLKAENILWFPVDPTGKSSVGILQIADFGLGKFHRQDSRSMSIRAAGSPMYLPPELRLNIPIGRAGDIWSLACLYLEFTSWILTGSANINGLSMNLNFFELVDGTRAIVRHEVFAWVQQLRERPRCSALIHDLLDLIMDDALIPDAQERIKASDLWEKFKILLNKAKEDQSFLLDQALRHTRSAPAPASSQTEVPTKDVTDRIAETPGRPRRVQTWAPT